MRKVEAAKQAGMSEKRVRQFVLAGDPDSLAEQTQAYLDAGIEGLTLSLPDVHDLEAVALVGKTLGPMLAAPVA
jgi:alkanesulfonate monooxygenase SsuD/methylene tetrahydromethanopterin reductase-like flavin-dependent oxidoreductase (luciferase family)